MNRHLPSKNFDTSLSADSLPSSGKVKRSWLDRLFRKDKRILKSRTIEQTYETKRVFNWNTPFWMMMGAYVLYVAVFGLPQ